MKIFINGSKISFLRKERGMSQERMAEAVGITRCQLQRIESGKSLDMYISTAMRVASILQVTVEELCLVNYEEGN